MPEWKVSYQSIPLNHTSRRWMIVKAANRAHAMVTAVDELVRRGVDVEIRSGPRGSLIVGSSRDPITFTAEEVAGLGLTPMSGNTLITDVSRYTIRVPGKVYEG